MYHSHHASIHVINLRAEDERMYYAISIDVILNVSPIPNSSIPRWNFNVIIHKDLGYWDKLRTKFIWYLLQFLGLNQIRIEMRYCGY